MASLSIKKQESFFLTFKKTGNQVYVFQMRMKKDRDIGFLADYNILNKGFNIVTIKRRKSRFLAYAKTLIKAFLTIRKVDFVYLFYPGHYCSALALMSIILRKRFGFYIRGEQGITSKISQYLYRKSNVIFTVSPKFTNMVNQAGAKAVTFRPMMEFNENDIVLNREYYNKKKYRLLFVGRIERDKGVYEP